MTKNMNKITSFLNKDMVEFLDKDLDYFSEIYSKVEQRQELANATYLFLSQSSPSYFFEKLKREAAFNDAFKHVDDAAVAISSIISNIEDLIEFYEGKATNVDLGDLLKEYEICIEDVKESLDNLDTCLFYLKRYCNDLFDENSEIIVDEKYM